VYSFQNFHPETGSHGVYVGTAPETAMQARAAIREELSRLASDSLTIEEIAEGKSQLKGQVTLSLESPSSRMYRAAGVALYDEPFRSLDQVLALIDDITPEVVAEVSAAFFDPDKQTVLALGGGDW
jgi:predicted Zn-dependent peptidase